MNDAQNTVDVLLTGKTLPYADIDQAAASFAGLTRLSPEQARSLITSGKPTLLKRGLSTEKGTALTARFASMGIEAITRPGAPITASRQEAPKQTTAPNVSQVQQGAKSGQQPYAQLGASFCTNCGNAVVEQAVACTNCGFPPRLEKKFCHNCGTSIDARQVMCVKCGAALAGHAAPGALPAATGPTAYVPPSGEPMTFGKAVSTCLKKYAVFSGRASRAECWFYSLFSLLLFCFGGLVFGVVAQLAGGSDAVNAIFCSLLGLLALVMWLPGVAVTVRRLHDTDRSAWFLLVSLIPVVGPFIFLVLALLKGTPGPNRFGEAPGTAASGSYNFSASAHSVAPSQSSKADAFSVQAASGRVSASTRPRRKAISFPDAMKSCFKKYAVISGRASRAEFWYFVLVCHLIGMFFSFAISFTQFRNELYIGNMDQSYIITFVAVPFLFIFLHGFVWSSFMIIQSFAGSSNIYIISLAFILFVQWIPGISVSIRRLHDIDKSGWFLLLGAIPFLGPILLFVFFLRYGTEEGNRFGEAPGVPSINKES